MSALACVLRLLQGPVLHRGSIFGQLLPPQTSESYDWLRLHRQKPAPEEIKEEPDPDHSLNSN